MNEIDHLDKKYFVIKTDDVRKYLSPRGLQKPLLELLGIISISRGLEKKDPSPEYVVLNLDDDISLAHLNGKLTDIIHERMLNKMFPKDAPEISNPKVRDIAVIIVNAILKAKRENQIVNAMKKTGEAEDLGFR